MLLVIAGITWFPFAPSPAPGESRVRLAPAGARNHIYYGPSNSIAVLPLNCARFDLAQDGTDDGKDGAEAGNTESGDPVQAYGLAELLIELLVKNSNLQITSATSSFYFADSVEAPRVLAERLRVNHLLYGCIRAGDDDLDIGMRLFDVQAQDSQWSQGFTGPQDQVLAFIEQISKEVSEVAGQQAVPADSAFGSALALQHYLQGRFFYRSRGLKNLEKAETAFRRVLEINPASAPAWLSLAQVFLEPAWPGTADSPGFEQAREAALKALELDPGLGGAHLVLSRISRIYDWDWPVARQHAQKALDLQAGKADILANASLNEFIFGEFEQAVALLESAISRDPLQLQHLLRLGLAHEYAENYASALIAYRQLLGFNSDYPGAHAYRARVKLAQKKYPSALAEAELEQNPFWGRYARILSLIALGRGVDADPLLEAMKLENAGDAAFQIAEIHAFRGDADIAFEWLERAFEQRDGGMSEMIGNHFLASLTEDERWKDLLVKMDLLVPAD